MFCNCPAAVVTPVPVPVPAAVPDSQITFFSGQGQRKNDDDGKVIYSTLNAVPSDPSI